MPILKPSPEDLIKSAVRSILKNKGRTILTSLGIIIGVTSVILLTSIGSGLKSYISSTFESLGSNIVYVLPGQIFSENGGFTQQGGPPMVTLTFDDKDTNRLSRGLKNAIVLPASETRMRFKYRLTEKQLAVAGVTYDYGENRNLIPPEGQGRWFTREEEDKRDKVAVIGHKVWEDLFNFQPAIGKTISAGGKNFKVIGISEKKGGFGGGSLDGNVFIPLETYFNMVGDRKIQSYSIAVDDKDEIEPTKTDIQRIMQSRYDTDEFSVFDQSQLLTSINSIIGILTVGLTGIAAISLVVGGIGIMNIMLVTVSERTREIGLRKAIGAYPRAILLQFLFEAVILSGLGGLIGILLGWAGTLAINRFFPAQLTLSSILIAFGVSFAVGIIFGVAPARKASKLSPIEALRYE